MLRLFIILQAMEGKMGFGKWGGKVERRGRELFCTRVEKQSWTHAYTES